VHILFAPSNFSCCRLQPSACLSFCLIFQSVQPLLPAPQPYWRRLGDLAATTRGLSFSPRSLVTLFFFHLRISHVAVSLLSPFGHVFYLLILSSSVLSLACQDPCSLATVATYLCGYPLRFGYSEPAQDYFFSITFRSHITFNGSKLSQFKLHTPLRLLSSVVGFSCSRGWRWLFSFRPLVDHIQIFNSITFDWFQAQFNPISNCTSSRHLFVHRFHFIF